MPIREVRFTMKSLDLVTYAAHSRKIPSRLLCPAHSEGLSTRRLLIAHGADFWSSYLMASAMSLLCLQSVQLILAKSGISFQMVQTNSFDFTFRVFPMVMFSYFFFCYLMNSGQSYGMFLVKRRIEMEEFSFMKAFKWASHSTLLCFSMGLSFFLRKEMWKEIKGHDYLYQELMTHKDHTYIDLLSRTEEEGVFGREEIIFTKAA